MSSYKTLFSPTPMTRVLGSTIAGCWAEVCPSLSVSLCSNVHYKCKAIVWSVSANICCTNSSQVNLICVFSAAEREEMISCVHVSREEERVAVAFSRPVNVCTIPPSLSSSSGVGPRLLSAFTSRLSSLRRSPSASCSSSMVSPSEWNGGASTQALNTALSGYPFRFDTRLHRWMTTFHIFLHIPHTDKTTS